MDCQRRGAREVVLSVCFSRVVRFYLGHRHSALSFLFFFLFSSSSFVSFFSLSLSLSALLSLSLSLSMRKRGCWLSCVCGRGGEKKRREEGGEGEEEEKRKKRGLNSPRNVCEKKKERCVCLLVVKHLNTSRFFLSFFTHKTTPLWEKFPGHPRLQSKSGKGKSVWRSGCGYNLRSPSHTQ